MAQFINILMLCMCFAYAQSEECLGIKLGNTGCVPQQHVKTIFSQPSTPLPISIIMDICRVTEIDISSSTMTVLLSLTLYWKDNRYGSSRSGIQNWEESWGK